MSTLILFKNIFHILNYKTLIITALALLATWYCRTNQYYAEFPMTLVSIAIIFPVVFAIKSAYDRRERALQSLAQCKGYLFGYYRLAVDHLKKPNSEETSKIHETIVHIFQTMKNFLESKNKDAKQFENEIFLSIKSLSESSRRLRDNGLPGRFVSRMSEYQTRFTVAFEDMKMIFWYRTPIVLRAYGKVFIYAFPILYAPYFNYLSQNYSFGLPIPIYYLMPVLISFILSSLDNIQTELENPYDQIGKDDVTIDLDSINQMIVE